MADSVYTHFRTSFLSDKLAQLENTSHNCGVVLISKLLIYLEGITGRVT